MHYDIYEIVCKHYAFIKPYKLILIFLFTINIVHHIKIIIQILKLHNNEDVL